MEKSRLAADPRGLIYESYRIEGISMVECRSIFFDWALGLPPGVDLEAARRDLIAAYQPVHPDHPMTTVLQETPPAEGASPQKRRGGRAANPRAQEQQ